MPYSTLPCPGVADLSSARIALRSSAGCQSAGPRDNHRRNQPRKRYVLSPRDKNYRAVTVVSDRVASGHIRRARRRTYSARYINPKRKTEV
jgi:hypothetical protein